MPLLDQFGNEIPLRRGSPRPRKPKNVKKAPRVSPRTQARTLQALSLTHPVEAFLTTKHNINGREFGPGRVVVPRETARALAEAERRAASTDANFASTRAFIVGPGRSKGAVGVREVAPEYFDVAQENAVPFGEVSRTGEYRGPDLKLA